MSRDAPGVPHGDADTPPTASGDGDGPPDDVDRDVVEEWTAETTSFERVYQVLRGTHDPESADSIAERARVSATTARKHLRTLADVGEVTTTQDGRTTLYRRSEVAVVTEHAQHLLAEHSLDEIAAGVADMKATIRDWREEHGVTSPEELARRMDVADADGEAGALVREWQPTRRNLALAEATLAIDEAIEAGQILAAVDEDASLLA